MSYISITVTGRASYLSTTICNEFIDIIGKKVFSTILDELKEAQYYSISVDSTPDVTHTDQLAFCVRYVKAGSAVERFLQFIPIEHHTSEYLCGVVLNFLSTHGISILDCRGQSYDNANNMAGCFSGLQSRIMHENNLAKFFPCAAHSLCLIGSNRSQKLQTRQNSSILWRICISFSFGQHTDGRDSQKY